MPEPLKNVYTRAFLSDLANRVDSVANKFNQNAFVSDVMHDDWANLELKARMSKISNVLHDSLANDFATNAEILSEVARSYRASGQTGFEYMFLPDYIEKHGTKDFAISMKALAAMTETGSAEFAIRPFIQNQQDKALRQLMRWANSRDEHLRRLASEGSRPRLPWAMALPEFKRDPAPILPILESLKSDHSLYVRRSVANNLNDISKDHPKTTLKLAYDWQGQSQDTDWLIKHACRGLLKAGHPEALTLFGYAPPDNLTISQFKLGSKKIRFGEALEFEFALQSHQRLGRLRLEYGVDFVKANGSLSRKVFKISEADIRTNTHDVVRKHKFVPISTRVHYPGKHSIAILVNGVEMAKQSFQLEIDRST